MQFNIIALAPIAALAAAESLTYGETFSLTKTINQNGNVYTKTRVEVFTGQATTDPTSGTATTVFTVENSLATYTKTVVETYSKTTTFPSSIASPSSDTNTSDDITTTVTYSQELQTYTKTLTGASEDLSGIAGSATSTNGALGLAAGLGSVGSLALAAAFLI
ncbi:hypothetical protein BON22_3157 [Cyberlindnera fabianii]|uniref:Uncharacterized protein n=1 Tax=Cyberlindnera fabianii TaxID=36022 RepID=A0A1V2L5J3_CYBFA|nr:hypothetical protein BON22_3157 [Cyberlindnera fabianii]